MIEGTKSKMQSIPFDTFGKVASYLTINELGILTSSCKTFFEYRNYSQLWDAIKQRGQKKLLKSLQSHLVLGYNSTCDADLNKQIELARQISKLETLQTVRWRRPEYFPVKETDNDFRLFRMEAHTMNTFLDRFLIIVGGWSESSENEITVLDGALLPECILSIPTTTSSFPRFRYGFSTVVYDNDLWVFGGCRNGGYSADCNDLYMVKLKFSIQPESEETFNSWETVRTAPMGTCSHISATYSDNLTVTNDTQGGQIAAASYSTTSYVPSHRAYHSAVCSRYNNKDVMVVFGGLHEQRPTNSLELMYFEHNQWFSPDNVVGQPPSPRFGHSCLLASNGNMIYTGGSDGNDLWRNGKEFHEIYILSIIPSTVNDQLVWKKLSLDPGVSRLVPGRCHAAASIGDRMIFFGGGANISDDLTVLRADAIRVDTKEQEEEYSNNSSLLYRPEILRSKYRPAVRSSSVAAVIGPYWCMYGGWNKTRRELGDFWVLDLTAGMSPPAAARSVSSVHSNEMSRYIFEEVNVRDQVLNATDNYELSDQDDDVNDDEFLSDGRGFINNIPIGQVFLAMLTRGLDFIPAVQYVQSRRNNEEVERDALDDDEVEFDHTLEENDDDDENNYDGHGNAFDRTQYAEIASDDEDENTE